MATSKVTKEVLQECIKEMREKTKERKFAQTVELQVALKDYDPAKDKRFVGSVKLPNCPRPALKICLIADEKHKDEAKAANIDNLEVVTLDELKKYNKDKKLIKKWAKKYYLLLATDSLVKKVPVVVGPILSRIGRFPQPITHNEPLKNKVDDVRSTVKWQLKKVTNLNVAVGNEKMEDKEIQQNVSMSLNFLASLLKKQW
jgi:large subunit ribosomal protein L10Ae